LPFKVIELMVTSKPTTEASGASSPVTKTAEDCEDKVEEEFDPQLAASSVSANKSTVPISRFMANSV
jgi:hypothetical protein